jgi:hypothetical protein
MNVLFGIADISSTLCGGQRKNNTFGFTFHGRSFEGTTSRDSLFGF